MGFELIIVFFFVFLFFFVIVVFLFFFFFSSRRRHTRWPRDWSSDACSSDLTVDFLQLCVINISSESVLYRVQINPMTVSCDLHAIANPAGAIFHELMSPSANAPAYQVGND